MCVCVWTVCVYSTGKEKECCYQCWCIVDSKWEETCWVSAEHKSHMFAQDVLPQTCFHSTVSCPTAQTSFHLVQHGRPKGSNNDEGNEDVADLQ